MKRFMIEWAHRTLMWMGYVAATFSFVVMAHG